MRPRIGPRLTRPVALRIMAWLDHGTEAQEESVQPSRELRHKVALIDYDPALFAPMGDEAERLAAVDALWTVHQCRSAEETLAAARDAVVVVVQSVRPLLTRAVIAQLPAARCLIRAGAGYDSIDYKAATAYGKMVCNTPTYCTDDVADHAIALMLASLS